MITQYSIRALPKPQVQLLVITNQSRVHESQRPTFMITSKLPINPNFSQTGQKNEVFRRKKYKRFHITEIHSVQILEKPVVFISIQKVDLNFLNPPKEFLDQPESSNKSMRKVFEDLSDIPNINSCSVSEIDFCFNSRVGSEKISDFDLCINTRIGYEKKEPYSDANNTSIVYPEVLRSEEIFKRNIENSLAYKPIECKIKPKKIMNYPNEIKITISSLEDNQFFTPEKPEEKLKSFLEISICNPLSIQNPPRKKHSKSLPKLKPRKKTEPKIVNLIKISESLKKSQKSLKLLPRETTKPTNPKFSINLKENSKGPYIKSFSVSTKPINNPYNIKWDKKVLKKNLSIKIEKPQISLPRINFCKSTKP